MRASVESERLAAIEDSLIATARRIQDELPRTIAALVAVPSENTPPTGSEYECQCLVLSRLRALDMSAETFELESVEGFLEHPERRPGRDYARRPDVAGILPGSGGGRSLLLSGHVDTVPRGTTKWKRDPFGAEVEGNRLYGLGSNDMKGGIGAMLTVLRVLKEAGVTLRGDLRFETVVDEEFGGVNGTLAARMRGPKTDAAVICEPSQKAICPAQTGGRTAHILLRGAASGILYEGKRPPFLTDQLACLLSGIDEFARDRKATAPWHPLYSQSQEPVPVWVTRINMGGWGSLDPQTLPSACRVEVYWQAMPGEDKEAIDREFFAWLERAVGNHRDVFSEKPEVVFPFEWLPGSAIDPAHPLVTGLAAAYQSVTGEAPAVCGIGGPCDMFLFHQRFDTPAVLFGPSGGNTHAPDEWVDLDSVQCTVETLLRFVCRWCGIDWDRSRPT